MIGKLKLSRGRHLSGWYINCSAYLFVYSCLLFYCLEHSFGTKLQHSIDLFSKPCYSSNFTLCIIKFTGSCLRSILLHRVWISNFLLQYGLSITNSYSTGVIYSTDKLYLWCLTSKQCYFQLVLYFGTFDV